MTTPVKVATTSLLIIALITLGTADYYMAGREYAAQLLGTPMGGIEKMEEPDVEATAATLDLSAEPLSDPTFLTQLAGNTPVASLILLREEDRIGSISWVDGDAKGMFINLKEALLPSFSPRVERLSDRTEHGSGPTRNILTFHDPALSEETLTFVRIRERLYEFHAAEGHEEAMQTLIDALTRA